MRTFWILSKNVKRSNLQGFRNLEGFFHHGAKFILTGILMLFLYLPSFSQTRPQVVNLEQLQKLYIKDNDTTYVLNFWATWCSPCVEEMPFVDGLTQDFKDKKVKVILACMDDPEDIDTLVMPYLIKQKIQSQVVIFSEPKPNHWIPIFNKDWTGAIPATLIRNGKTGREEFYQRKFGKGELNKIVESFQ